MRLFDAYAEDHAELCAAAGRSIGMMREQAGEARRDAQAEAEATLIKADELVQQMELEAKSVGARAPEGRELSSRAKASKNEVTALRTSLRQAAASLSYASRAELLGSSSSGDEATDDRARLLRMGERIQDGTSRLQQATRTVLDTEAIGASVLGDLRSQRETITHATGTLQRANEGLSRSKRTLAAISRRALGNKLIMWGMIAMLSVGVLLLLYVQVFGFSKAKPDLAMDERG